MDDSTEPGAPGLDYSLLTEEQKAAILSQAVRAVRWLGSAPNGPLKASLSHLHKMLEQAYRTGIAIY